jgi:GNAT superfamily N-acetyltransferase
MQYLYRTMPRTRPTRSGHCYRRRVHLGPWREEFTLPNGRRVLLRPIVPEDARALRDGFGTLSAEEVRMRFLHPLNELSEDMARQLTQVDPTRGIALVVAEPLPPGEALIGAVARISLGADGREAEFALLVARPLAGQGLGTYLMRRLIQWCARRRVTLLYGDVLNENRAMLKLTANLGFEHLHLHGDQGLTRVRRVIGDSKRRRKR